jgi:hypothetical protein
MCPGLPWGTTWKDLPACSWMYLSSRREKHEIHEAHGIACTGHARSSHFYAREHGLIGRKGRKEDKI